MLSHRFVLALQVDDLPSDFSAVKDPETRPLVTAKLELEDEMATKSANIQEALPMIALANSTPGMPTAMKVEALTAPTCHPLCPARGELVSCWERGSVESHASYERTTCTHVWCIPTSLESKSSLAHVNATFSHTERRDIF